MIDEAYQPRNRLLATMPTAELEALRGSLRVEELVARRVLFDVDTPIEQVYFPESALISIVGVMSDGTAIETATIGAEGMVGLPVFLGTDRMSAQALAQVPGRVLAMDVADFRAALQISDALVRGLQHYTQALFVLIAQSSACNRVHTMIERCARWLLHVHDGVGRDSFQLTHQFLSQMLGVRRATVTEAMARLQRAGAIVYEMGNVRVCRRGVLEANACECYATIAHEFDRLCGTSWAPALEHPLARFEASAGGISSLRDGEAANPEAMADG